MARAAAQNNRTALCRLMVAWLLVGWLYCGAATDAGGAAEAEADKARAGERPVWVVPVPLPIQGTVDQELRQKIDQLVQQVPAGQVRPILVLEFRATAGQTGRGSQFERCLHLARYLSKLNRLRTVAYLPGTVEGHAVLVVVACEEIIMAPDAQLGPAGIDETEIDDTLRDGYRNEAKAVPPAVAMGLLDPQQVVYKTRGDGARYVLGDELQQLRAQGLASEVETIKQAGVPGQFSAADLRYKYGLVSHLARDRRELADALNVAPMSLDRPLFAAQGWRAARVDIHGPLHRRQVNWIQRNLQHRLQQSDVNLVFVCIDSPGGSLVDALRLAQLLAELDSDRVFTVAFIPYEARADAALLAVACDRVAMRPDAVLGGPGQTAFSAEQLEDVRPALKQLATQSGHDWSLLAALLDPRLEVHRYVRAGTGQVRYFCREELDEQPDRDRWRQEAAVNNRSGLRGDVAEQLGLARHVVEDFDALLRIYNVESPPLPIRPPWTELWVEEFAEFLASPVIAAMLLFAAWFFLSAELSHPGLSAPGFVSAVCFMLFFWSQFCHGNADWLEILLFVCGVLCVLIEIFLIPGIGVFGIGGAVMIFLALILASQSFVIPQNEYQMSQLPISLSMLLAAVAGVLAALLLVPRIISGTPVLRRLLLQPPDEVERFELSRRESLAHWEHLLGKRGVTTTTLRPAGKARFGDEVVDVLSRGEIVPRGTEVYVEEVQGNRVVVVPVEQEQAGQ